MPSQSTGDRPNLLPAPVRSIRFFRQTPSLAHRQSPEAQTIAVRVRDRSRSEALEAMLRRQRARATAFQTQESSSKYPLRYLTVRQQRGSRYFQICLTRSKKPFCAATFESLRYCTEAAAELERTFAMESLIDLPLGETMEQVEAIVQSYVWREQVDLQLGVA